MKKKIIISIIITAYKRPLNVIKIIQKLKNQSFPFKKIEILVCDSNSDGNKVTKDFIIKNSYKNIKYINSKKNHQAFKRNLGAKYAKGKFIIFLDDDCFPTKNFLSNYHKKFLQTEDKTIYCGDVENLSNENIKNLSKYRNERTIKSKDYNSTNVPLKNIVTMNMGLEKANIINYDKFFNVSFNYYGFEDFELSYRLKKKGFSFKMVNSKIYHKDLRNFETFLEKYFYLGKFSIKEFERINLKAAKESIFYKISNNLIIKIILNIPFICFILNILQIIIVKFEKKTKIYLPLLYKIGILIAFMRGLKKYKYGKYGINSYKKSLNDWYK